MLLGGTVLAKGRLLSTLKANFRSNKCYRFSAILAIILIIAEIFVFNFNSFILFFGDYEQQDLNLSEASFQNFTDEDENSATLTGSGYATLAFSNVDKPIRTLSVDLICSENITSTTVYINASDETSKDVRNWVGRMVVINGNSRSTTIPCHFSGNVGELQINLDLEEKESVTIKGITINKPIQFRFSFVRLLVIFLFIFIPYFFINSVALKKTVHEDKRSLSTISLVITEIFIIFAILCSSAYRTYSLPLLGDGFTSKRGNQITKELVEAFEHGQVHLVEEPPEELLNLDNPYDRRQRDSAVDEYLWDHCLYDGHYYSYYGVAPVILLFLPYHIITGYYFPTTWAVMIFGIIGIIFLSKLYRAIIEKWFGHLQLNHAVMGLILLQIASGIWVNLSRSDFYEIAISSGFAFVLIGAYYLVKSNIIGDGEISLPKLALSTTFLSLAVLSRPTLAVYCVASLAFIYYGFKKTRSSPFYKKRDTAVYLCSALLPYIVFGGFQMWYNFARFDSPFDFGINYSLTINDLTKTQFFPILVIMFIYAALLAPPYFQPVFPFFFSNYQSFNINGYYFADDRKYNAIAVGLLFRALPVVSYLFWKRAYKYVDKKTARRSMALIGLSCVLAPLIIMGSVWECGYAVRYNADFSWQMLMGALIILFVIIQYCNNNGVRNIITKFMSVSVVLCFMINFAQLYSFIINRYVCDDITRALYSFERLFEFWR